MTFSPAIPARATDWDCILDDARASLLANTVVDATVGYMDGATRKWRIFPGAATQGTTGAYIVLSLIPTYASSYGVPGVNALLDVSCYGTTGSDAASWGTRTVRALMKAALAALLDTPWVTTAMAAEGVRLLSANAEEPGTGGRTADTVAGGTMTRGKQFTIRIHAAKV